MNDFCPPYSLLGKIKGKFAPPFLFLPLLYILCTLHCSVSNGVQSSYFMMPGDSQLFISQDDQGHQQGKVFSDCLLDGLQVAACLHPSS